VTNRTARRAETRIVVAFLCTAAAGVALAVVYWNGGDPQLEGLVLGIGLGGLFVGFVTWGNHLLPQGPETGPREEMASEAGDVDALEVDVERGGALTRRKLILGSLGAAAVAMIGAALFPIRSLGPRPGRSLLETPWRDGVRLVTQDGRAVRATEVPLGGLVTVFPESDPTAADGQTVLMRVEPSLLRLPPGREDWAPDGLIAYSKICTHAGCPVGLYQASSHELLCPCHQSAFDVLRHARPTFGPAAAPLPQLPLRLDGDFIVARGDFSEPVGPAFWRRS
jgi:ubiquinol-cytochrome c reductase iron-sulfur subunit